MGHRGNSGRIAIGAFLAALALLALAGITLHGTVFLWFLAASAAAYTACVAEVVVRRRHRTLAASGIGSILFIGFSIAFLRQWGLAFNAGPDALSNPVDTKHPDLFFYLAAASGAATLLLLVAGTILPGRGRRTAGNAARRRPATARSQPPRAAATRRVPTRTATARPAQRSGTGRQTPAQPAKARPAKAQSPRTPAPRAASPGLKRPASGTAGSPAGKSAGKSLARPSARTTPRR